MERVAAAVLRGKGYDVFFPTHCPRGHLRERSPQTVRPLFPGYLFCQLDIAKRLPVLTVPGILHIVGAGKTPLPVSDIEIVSLRIIVESGVPLEPHEFLQCGQRIEIERGPLKGAYGDIVEVKDQFKLVACVTLLQRALSVEIDSDWVSVTAAPSAASQGASRRPVSPLHRKTAPHRTVSGQRTAFIVR